MKKMMSILFLLFIVFASTASANYRWQDTGIHSKNIVSNLSFDTKSFMKTGDKTYSVWIKMQYIEEYGKKLAKDLDLSISVSYCVSKEEYNYTNQTFRDLSYTYYDEEGNSLYTSNRPSDWINIIPDSIGEAKFMVTYDYYEKYHK
ncbi:MAG: hypothetical protein LBO03_04505 [Acidaminococcales bacterium]|jgi:hypothetical protein|nr:hypothetical protein [Acidaminococcales bacterium]